LELEIGGRCSGKTADRVDLFVGLGQKIDVQDGIISTSLIGKACFHTPAFGYPLAAKETGFTIITCDPLDTKVGHLVKTSLGNLARTLLSRPL
jgi:hypothetical protein